MLNPVHLIQFFWHEISFIAKRIVFAKKNISCLFFILKILDKFSVIFNRIFISKLAIKNFKVKEES